VLPTFGRTRVSFSATSSALSQTFADRPAWPKFGGNGISGPAGDDRVQGQPLRTGRHPVGRPLDVAYPISYRQLEEMMEEHGVEVDHATLNRWVLKYVPLLDQAFRARTHPVGRRWRLDETSYEGRHVKRDFILC
jgi:hypothetical protein